MDYFFEEKQELQFTVYDIDTKNPNKLDDQDFLGTIEVRNPATLNSSRLLHALQEDETMPQTVAHTHRRRTKQCSIETAAS